MKTSSTVLIFVVAILALVLFGTGSLYAQVSGSDSITVTATNEGVFSFAIADASFLFGNVNANGTNGPAGASVSNGSSGSTYTVAAASTFDISSASVRTVYIFNNSSSSTINWGAASRLEMQIPTTGLGEGTSCGYKAFDTAGDSGAGVCNSGNLYYGLSVGNDAAPESGDLDLRLTVNNTDVTTSNTWTVSLTATGI